MPRKPKKKGIEMDIKAIKEIKEQCESEIKAILKTFERQTELSVCGIVLVWNKMMSGRSEVTIVKMDVRINGE